MRILAVSLPIALMFSFAASLDASQVPTQGELQRLIANPQSGAAVRQRLLQSGLTPDQIRSRLQAAGLPTNALDSYIRGGQGALNPPSDSVLGAITALGLGSPNDIAAFADALAPT